MNLVHWNFSNVFIQRLSMISYDCFLCWFRWNEIQSKPIHIKRIYLFIVLNVWFYCKHTHTHHKWLAVGGITLLFINWISLEKYFRGIRLHRAICECVSSNFSQKLLKWQQRKYSRENVKLEICRARQKKYYFYPAILKFFLVFIRFKKNCCVFFLKFWLLSWLESYIHW